MCLRLLILVRVNYLLSQIIKMENDRTNQVLRALFIGIGRPVYIVFARTLHALAPSRLHDLCLVKRTFDPKAVSAKRVANIGLLVPDKALFFAQLFYLVGGSFLVAFSADFLFFSPLFCTILRRA